MSFVVLKEVEEPTINFLKPEEFNTTSDPVLNEALRAAEAHRRVRASLQPLLKPGVSLRSVVDMVEKNSRILLKGERNNGIGFPCGISLNDCAAHFTLNPWNEDVVLKESDVLKIDFGTHCNGRIMDSALTVCFDPKYEQLLQASKEATAKGIEVLGVDACVCEIGRDINEVFRSFELEENGRSIPIRPVKNLNGHSITQFVIHGGVSIPSINNDDYSRISEGFCAIETFATTGKAAYVTERGECSHYMIDKGCRSVIYDKKNQEIYNLIKKEFGTLPFSPKHVEFYMPNVRAGIKLLAARRFLEPYPPLYDSPDARIAQFEHTVYLSENSKTVLTKGDDY